MNTRYGRNVLQDLANLSGREIPTIRMDRLASRYESAVEDQKRREEANSKEFRLNLPHMVQVQNRIAERLEAEASEVNGKLPVASVYEAYRHVRGHADRDRDPGLRALHGHLESMWKKSRAASITANLYLTLHDHYKRNFPKSAAAQVIVEIGQNGYTTLPLSDLTHIASSIETQEDFDRAMVYHGLNGPLPHQAKARRFVLALLNVDDEDNTYGLEGMENSPPFVGEEGDEAPSSFVPPRETPQKDVKTRGPKAQRTAQFSSDSIDELRDYLSRDLYIKDAETDTYLNDDAPDDVVHVGIIWTQSGYAGVEGMVYVSDQHPDTALQAADEMWDEHQRNDPETMKMWEDDAREELRRDRSLVEGEPSDEEVWELADTYMREQSHGRVWTVTSGELLNMLRELAPEKEGAHLILVALGEVAGQTRGREGPLTSKKVSSWKKALEEEMPRRNADWQVNEEVLQSIGEHAGNYAADLAQSAGNVQEAAQDLRDEFGYLGYESMTDEDWEDIAEYFMSMGPGDRTPEEEDYVITPAGTLGGSTSAGQVGGKHLGTFSGDEEALDAIREDGQKNNFFPSVWHLSDHGNYHLIEDFDWTVPPSQPSGGDWDL